MLLRNKSTNETYHVPSGIGKAMIHAGLAEEVIPAAPKQTPRTKWSANEGRYAGIDYQYPPYIFCVCSTCSQKHWVEKAKAFVFRHCGVAEPIPSHVWEEYDRLVRAYNARSKKPQREPAISVDTAEADRVLAKVYGVKSRRELIVEDLVRWGTAKKG